MTTRRRRFWPPRLIVLIVEGGILFTSLGMILGLALAIVAQRFGVQAAVITFAGFALAGVALGFFFDKVIPRWRDIEFQEAELSLPAGGSITLSVRGKERTAAWHLFVELITRISIQPLAPQEGYIREALNSLHQVFQDTRRVLREMEPSRPTNGVSVEVTAVHMLNKELRPFLAKWHRRLGDHERTQGQAAWPDEMECRTELEQLRKRLVEYARAFGEAAGVKNLEMLLPGEAK